MNLFSYCNNNPIMYYDPSGHFPILTSLFIDSIIFGAVGAWKSLNQGYFRINYMFNSLKGYNFIQNLVVSGIQVLQETYKQIIIRQVIKSIINLVV